MNPHVLAVPYVATPSFSCAFHDAQNRLNFITNLLLSTIPCPLHALLWWSPLNSNCLHSVGEWHNRSVLLQHTSKSEVSEAQKRAQNVFQTFFFFMLQVFKIAGQNIIDLAKKSLHSRKITSYPEQDYGDLSYSRESLVKTLNYFSNHFFFVRNFWVMLLILSKAESAQWRKW